MLLLVFLFETHIVSLLFGFAKTSVPLRLTIQCLIRNRRRMLPSPIQFGQYFVTLNLKKAASAVIAHVPSIIARTEI